MSEEQRHVLEHQLPISQLPHDKNVQIFSLMDAKTHGIVRRVAKSWLWLSDALTATLNPSPNLANFQWLMLKLSASLKAYVKNPDPQTQQQLTDLISRSVMDRVAELKNIQGAVQDRFQDVDQADEAYERLAPILDEIIKLTNLVYLFNSQLANPYLIRPRLINFTFWHDSRNYSETPVIHLDYWCLVSGFIDYKDQVSLSNTILFDITFAIPAHNEFDFAHNIRKELRKAATIYKICFQKVVDLAQYKDIDDKALNAWNFKWQLYYRATVEKQKLEMQAKLAMSENPQLQYNDVPAPDLTGDVAKTHEIYRLRFQIMLLEKQAEIAKSNLDRFPKLYVGIRNVGAPVVRLYTNEQTRQIDQLSADIAELKERLNVFKQQLPQTNLTEPRSAPRDNQETTATFPVELKIMEIDTSLNNSDQTSAVEFPVLLVKFNDLLSLYTAQPEPEIRRQIAKLFAKAVKNRMDELLDLQFSIKSRVVDLQDAKEQYPRLLVVVNEIGELTKLLYIFNARVTDPHRIRPSLTNFTLWLNSIEIAEGANNPFIYLDFWMLSSGLFNYEASFSLKNAKLGNIIFASSESEIDCFVAIKEQLKSASRVHNVQFVNDHDFGDYQDWDDKELDDMNQHFSETFRQQLANEKNDLQIQVDALVREVSVARLSPHASPNVDDASANEIDALKIRQARLRIEVDLLARHVMMQLPRLLFGIYNKENNKHIQQYMEEKAKEIATVQAETSDLRKNFNLRKQQLKQTKSAQAKRQAEEELVALDPMASAAKTMKVEGVLR